jgi:hypothetical protein
MDGGSSTRKEQYNGGDIKPANPPQPTYYTHAANWMRDEKTVAYWPPGQP